MLALVAAAILPLSVQASQGLSLSPDTPMVLKPAVAARVFVQCSRDAPGVPGAVWSPSTVRIAALEKSLLRFMDEWRAAGKAVPPAHRYGRPYAGFVEGGRWLVYGNFFPRTMRGLTSLAKPVVVCDGGPSFWGIVYAPQTDRCEELRFDGPPR